MTSTFINDQPYYDNPDVCPRCGHAWRVVEVLRMLDGTTRPAPPGFGLRYCPCAELDEPLQPLRYIQPRLL